MAAVTFEDRFRDVNRDAAEQLLNQGGLPYIIRPASVAHPEAVPGDRTLALTYRLQNGTIVHTQLLDRQRYKLGSGVGGRLLGRTPQELINQLEVIIAENQLGGKRRKTRKMKPRRKTQTRRRV